MLKVHSLLLCIPLLFFTSCFTVPKSKENEKSGIVIGKIEYKTNRRFWSLREGSYNDKVAVVIVNAENKKKTYTATSEDGIFVFYNVPCGTYRVWKWRKKIKANPTVSAYLTCEINGPDFTVDPDTISALQSILVIADIPKQFTYKINYSILYKDEKMEELTAFLETKDKNGYYQNYIWRKAFLTEMEDSIEISDDDIIENNILLSDNDFDSIENLYREKEYYLSCLLFYRMVHYLLRAHYVKSNGTEGLEGITDLRELARLAKIELSPDERMLLFDINNLNQKIINREIDENNPGFLTTSYIEDIFKKVSLLRDKLKKILLE